LDDNFELLAFPIDGHAISMRLPIDRFGLHKFNNKINDTFLKIVNRSIYSESLDIPDAICNQDLLMLAELEIFNNIFLGDNHLPAAQQCVNEIKQISRAEPQNIQITAKKFWIPWTFLYDKGNALTGTGDLSKNLT
jgi:hypothetical protein